MSCECPYVTDINYRTVKLHTRQCEIDNRSYKDFVQKPIAADKLAPLTARPKSTKGDFTGDRFKAETMRRAGIISKDHIPRRGKLFNITAIKRLRSN